MQRLPNLHPLIILPNRVIPPLEGVPVRAGESNTVPKELSPGKESSPPSPPGEGRGEVGAVSHPPNNIITPTTPKIFHILIISPFEIFGKNTPFTPRVSRKTMCGFVRVFGYRTDNQIDADQSAKPLRVTERGSSVPKMAFILRLRSLTVL